MALREKGSRSRAPDEVDLYVAGRIRERRKQLQLTQEDMAEGLGVTFQQVQKYEGGTNRVGAGRLFRIAQLLNAPVGHFFEGFQDPGAENRDDQDRDRRDTLPRREAERVVTAFGGIGRKDLRDRCLALLRALARHEGRTES